MSTWRKREVAQKDDMSRNASSLLDDTLEGVGVSADVS